MPLRRLIAVLLAVALGVGGFMVFKAVKSSRQTRLETTATEETPLVVEVAAAELGSVENTFVLDGTVEAETEVDVASKIAGKVRRVNFKEGDWVDRSDLVAELDRDEVVAQVNQARASLAAAKLNVGKARDSHKLQTVSTDTSVDQAEANLAVARARLRQAQTGIQITDDDVATSVVSAEESVRQVQARLDVLMAGSRTQEKAIAKEQVAQAKANMDTAKRDLERARRLLEAQAISRQQFDGAQLAFDLAAAQYQSALQQASLVDEGPRSEEIQAAEAQVGQARAMLDKAKAMRLQIELRQRDLDAAQEGVRQAEAAVRLSRASGIRDSIAAQDIKSAEAMVAQARANLQYAEAQLRNTYVYAPASGHVVRRNVEPGEITSPSVPILTLVNNAGVKVKCALSEERARFMWEGQQVRVTVDALPGAEFVGTVSVVSAAADPKSRVFEVQVRVPNPRGLIKSGMFARVTVQAAAQSGVLVIPYDAVVRVNGNPTVFTVTAGTARQRAVQLGLRQADKVAVDRGLTAGEQVVVAGQKDLQDGMRVKATQAGGASE